MTYTHTITREIEVMVTFDADGEIDSVTYPTFKDIYLTQDEINEVRAAALEYARCEWAESRLDAEETDRGRLD